MSTDDPVPNWKLNRLVDDAQRYFEDANQREREAKDRAKLIADAHARGWEQVAKAVNEGFRLVAEAIRSR